MLDQWWGDTAHTVEAAGILCTDQERAGWAEGGGGIKIMGSGLGKDYLV